MVPAGTKLARSAIMRARSVAGGSVTVPAAPAKAAAPVSAAGAAWSMGFS